LIDSNTLLIIEIYYLWIEIHYLLIEIYYLLIEIYYLLVEINYLFLDTYTYANDCSSAAIIPHESTVTEFLKSQLGDEFTKQMTSTAAIKFPKVSY